MKFRFATALLMLSALTLGLTSSTRAESVPLTRATVTETKNQVDYAPQQASERPAKVGDQVAGDDVLRTGERSLAELEFNDQTLARLGSNAIFSFTAGARKIALEKGLMLFHVPKGRGHAEISTAAVTAAITGTTGLAVVDGGIVKYIFLEGSGVFELDGKKVKVKGTEMLIVYPDGRWVKAPINLSLLFKTSRFLKDAEQKLHGLESWGEIAKNIARQLKEIQRGILIPTNYLVIGSADDLVTITGQPAGLAIEEALDQITPPVEVALLTGPDYEWNTGPGQEANGWFRPGDGGFVDVGGTGIIRGQLVWFTMSDLDLHLVLPGGSGEVYYGNPTVVFNAGRATAALDHDNLGGTIDIQPNQRVENIIVTRMPLAGTYTFYAEDFIHNITGPTVATLTLSSDSGRTVQQTTFTFTTSGQTSPSLTVTWP